MKNIGLSDSVVYLLVNSQVRPEQVGGYTGLWTGGGSPEPEKNRGDLALFSLLAFTFRIHDLFQIFRKIPGGLVT